MNEKSEKLITKNELDYCIRCGCPKDVCCGKNSVTLEWLEEKAKEIEQANECECEKLYNLLKAAKKEGLK